MKESMKVTSVLGCKMHESAFRLSTNVIQSWLRCGGYIAFPLSFSASLGNLRWGNALSQKLEVGERRFPVSYVSYGTLKEQSGAD